MLIWCTVFYLYFPLFTEHSTALPAAQVMQGYIKMNNENKLGNPGKKNLWTDLENYPEILLRVLKKTS